MTFRVIRGKHPLSVHVVWMALLLGALAWHHFFSPPACMFHKLTGFPCLSCGASRAADSLLKGDIIGMFYYNPLLTLFCVTLFFFSFFKLPEYIFRFKLTVSVGKRTALVARIVLFLMITANWTFLVVTGR